MAGPARRPADTASRSATARRPASGPTPTPDLTIEARHSAPRASAGRGWSTRRARAARPSTGRARSARPTGCSGPPTRRGARPGSRAASSLRLEVERRGVHAVAQAGRARAVVEDVAEVRAAGRAVQPRCGACSSDRSSCVLTRSGLDHVEEARPARAGLELRARVEQRRPAHDAAVRAVVVVVPVHARERALGLALLGDRVLDGAELAQASLEIGGAHGGMVPDRVSDP